MIILYGISNCDSVRKAKNFLAERGAAFEFHDFRKDGLTAVQVQEWLESIGAERLVNKRSTSWKNLTAQERDSLSDPAINQPDSKQQRAAIEILVAAPTLIKRPLANFQNGQLSVGFSIQNYTELLAAKAN